MTETEAIVKANTMREQGHTLFIHANKRGWSVKIESEDSATTAQASRGTFTEAFAGAYAAWKVAGGEE